MESCLDRMRDRTAAFQTRWNYLSPENQIREKRQRLMDLENRMQARAERIQMEKRHQLQLLIQKFSGLSPLAKLNQGYSYVEDPRGAAVTSVHQVKPGDPLTIQVSDGCIYGRVQSAEERMRG